MEWTAAQSQSSLELEHLKVFAGSKHHANSDLATCESREQLLARDAIDSEDTADGHVAFEIAHGFAPVVCAGLGWVHLSCCWLFAHRSISESHYKLVASIDKCDLASIAERIHDNCTDLRLPIAGAKIYAGDLCLLVVYLEAETDSPCISFRDWARMQTSSMHGDEADLFSAN